MRIDENIARRFLRNKLKSEVTADIFAGRVVDALAHLRRTAPERETTPTDFYRPRVHPNWPLKGSFRVTRGIDGKRFELVNRRGGFKLREVK